MASWFERYPVKYLLGTDPYDGLFEFRLGSLRYFDSGGYCYYNLRSYVDETLSNLRLGWDDIQFVIQNRDGTDMYMERGDFLDFCDMFVWDGFQPDFVIVGDGFTIQWEGPDDMQSLFVSFEDESRYDRCTFCLRSAAPYAERSRPGQRIANGLFGYETADRCRRKRSYPEHPGIDEIERRVSEAVKRMESPPDRIFMLNDPNVGDILLFLDRPSGDEPPENSWFQPLFGDRVHVFGIRDLGGCGPVSCICVYDSGRGSTLLESLSVLESDFHISRSFDFYRRLMDRFESFHMADYLDGKDVKNVYVDVGDLGTEHCKVYIQIDDPVESYGLIHPLSRANMLDLTVLAVDHPLDGRGLMRIYHNRRFDPPIDSEALDREIHGLLEDVPCYDLHGYRIS